MVKDARILVYKSAARMTVTPEDIRPHVELIQKRLAKLGEPKVATVVPADYDFGMMRMLELTAEGEMPHDFMVFRDLKAACQWLEVDPAGFDRLKLQ